MSYANYLARIEEMNYENDSRVRGSHKAEEMRERFSEREMTIRVEVYDSENDESFVAVFPARYEVCDVCGGTGKHVNPSIDCGGLTSSDFAEDPYFAEEYFGGAYDVTCYACHGNRVFPVIDCEAVKKDEGLTEQLELYEKQLEENAYFDSIARAERAMGA